MFTVHVYSMSGGGGDGGRHGGDKAAEPVTAILICKCETTGKF